MPNVTDQIKERIDIVEFISAYVNLRKAGRNYLGFCPFHSNTRTPAFTVYPDTQSYYCFGCKASGTVFDFLMLREGLEFKDALEQLAKRAGVLLKERTEQDAQQDQLRTRLLEINNAAATFFHHMLVKSPKGEIARAYVEQRKIDQPTVEAFQLGYSADEWSALLAYLTDRKGFEPEEIEAAGLAIRRESGGYYDRFRGRLMFPIRDAKGQVIAFGGRALGDAQPKYMNSPQTLLFDKSRVLYGLDLARDTIRSSDSTVIVEGYVDVIIAHQYGFHNVVAPLGTALTGEHVNILKKTSRNIYLALDADPAGIRATLKGVQTLGENLDGTLIAITSPQGIIGWQRDLHEVIKIIALPDGKDPDEVIQANPDQWRALVAGAQPAMDFYIRALTSDLDLHSSKGKSEAVARLAPLLVDIRSANEIEYAHYIHLIARLIDIEEQFIERALPARQRSSARRPPTVAPTVTSSPEDHMLGWLLRYPAARTAVQEKVRRDLTPFPFVEEIIEGTLFELFERVDNRAIWRAWQDQPAGTDPEVWARDLDDALREQAERVLSMRLPQPQAYRYVNDALECATILQTELARRWRIRVKQQISGVEDADEQAQVLERLVQIESYIGSLNIPKRSSNYNDLHSLHAV